MGTHSKDITDQLQTLGSAKTMYRMDSPDKEILETFPNQFPERDYVISIAFPEYTSLCPVTGQPDFATIVIEYIPEQLCVESKSFKLYMFAYRNHQSFMETITNQILNDFVAKLSPRWMRVKGLFAPRGGTALHVFAEHFAENEHTGKVKEIVSQWKNEACKHEA